MQNLTRDVIISDGKCSLHHYSFMFVAAVTFLIGLILQPDTIYEALQKHFRQQLNAGKTFQESEPSFRIPILEYPPDCTIERKTVVVRIVLSYPMKHKIFQ